ncbi:hypothetical protein ES705_47894 [subsurface metagenome]
MVKRCSMCFQTKDTLNPILSGAKVNVCKACAYKISAVTGFLEFHGIKLSYQPELLSDDSELPPKPPTKNKEATKSKKRAEKDA